MKAKDIRGYREQLERTGLTKVEMARLLDVNVTTWDAWEAGTMKPPVFLWRAMEEAVYQRSRTA